MGIGKFSTLAKDAIQFECRVLPNVYVGLNTFLSHRKVLSVFVHRDAANTIGVLAVKSLEFFGGEVVGLVFVADNEDDYIVLQEMNIVAFEGLLAHHAVEADVSPTYRAVLDRLFNVTARVEFICRFVEHVFLLLLLDRSLWNFFNFVNV